MLIRSAFSCERFGSSPVVKMRALFLMVLYSVLCCASSDSSQYNIETLMENVLVLRHNGRNIRKNVALTCGEAYQDQPVIWKKNGVSQPALQGNQVNVLVEEMDGGNYTCHLGQGEEYLNHTVIMIQLDNSTQVILEENHPNEGHIHCSAPNYKGSFHCSWTRAKYRSNAAVLLVKAERYLEKIPCELDADGSGIRCQDANCPYKEEQHRISLTIYIHSLSRLEVYTKAFYLREIVKPEKLPNLHASDGKVFSWNYPDSWEKPCTFFGLQFEVKVVKDNHSCNSEEEIMRDITDETKYEVNVVPKKYVFCVRARDKHTSGPFGHWSQCRVNKHGMIC
ncbi:interleukin-12 subunit beta [Enoplosus armatus]|uniref:interleukin-12 subunit beta n=1 Tax=Enoplosus armatus TaxID=215367 RepID=UPI003995FE6B